jgi:hypothetical protein
MSKLVSAKDGVSECDVFKYVFLVVCFLFLLLVHFVLWPMNTFSNEAAQKWKDLGAKSNAHRVMVASYLDCRSHAFGESPSGCQLLALNYGKARLFSDSQLIFSEIVVLSDEIALQDWRGDIKHD